ncbi:MAG: Ribokinase [uncultured Actinomycetospora sp.]|uniref:Ribokinase n=1 Tax=uncultured Actinomycetospora sp. TaxID=1135996 RepID=A0A6J4H5V5_9PSEU|nr:MAG: Ribokinase [uncultured Actinomycetospora sp.]
MAVVGAVNVDMVVATETLPGPGETVLGPGVEQHGGGKGANAAVAAARVGATVRFVGAVGADDLGRGALADLEAEGVGVDDVAVVEGATTGTALIVVDAHGENQIAVGAGANGRVDPERVRASLRAAEDVAVVLVSTEIPGDAVAAAVASAGELGVPCVLDPAPVVPVVTDLLRHGPVLTPNAGELSALARSAGLASGSPEEEARGLRERTGAAVVVTLGGDGVLVVDTDPQRLPAVPATVRDTTGAGDTFTGVLAARLAAGDDLVAAAAVANRAAALSVASVGARAGMPTVAELDAAADPSTRSIPPHRER